MKVITIMTGMPEVGTYPLIGKFFVGDAQNRLHCGSIAPPISLPLDEKNYLDSTHQLTELPCGTTTSLTSVPDFSTLLLRYQQTRLGQTLAESVVLHAKAATDAFNLRDYTAAVENARFAAFFSFFTDPFQKRAARFRNLALALCHVDKSEALNRFKFAHQIADTTEEKEKAVQMALRELGIDISK
eukprot:TRINITY_DN3144_c0_g1_i2.p1 TRINITY_DN3144_c0_g1~~TRINITY_DN3144_c0_g1_i2.p1  ORF type:complete len:186 (-),score=40.64 TRINITY_DN3144_c0_g1_i2:182-739(-)